MKAVVQKDPMGCGVACVAFVLNKSYPNARLLFRSGDIKAQTTGFSVKVL